MLKLSDRKIYLFIAQQHLENIFRDEKDFDAKAKCKDDLKAIA